jgi:hypothetical protein
MILFNASSIVAGGYDGRSGTLRLRYIDGDTYDYRNVPSAVFDDLGPPAAHTRTFTVAEVAAILTWWPRQERLSHSWKINACLCAHGMGFLATLCCGSSLKHTERHLPTALSTPK